VIVLDQSQVANTVSAKAEKSQENVTKANVRDQLMEVGVVGALGGVVLNVVKELHIENANVVIHTQVMVADIVEVMIVYGIERKHRRKPVNASRVQS